MKRALRFVCAALALCIACYLAGCRVVYAASGPMPVRVFRAERLEPEGWYETVFGAMQECSGKAKPYGALEWFVVGARKMGQIDRDGQTTDVAGLFSPPHRIYLDERSVMDAGVIGHEILHYLTGEYDTPHFADILEACGVG